MSNELDLRKEFVNTLKSKESVLKSHQEVLHIVVSLKVPVLWFLLDCWFLCLLAWC